MARLKLEHGARKRLPSRLDSSTRRKRPTADERKKKQREFGMKDRPAQEAVFLPSNEHLVKMIAMQGADDEEIAAMFGVPYEHFRAWRKLYPSFNDALNEGRLPVDANVTFKLYEQTQGFEYEEETATPKGGIVKVKRYSKPDTSAIKYWLENRRPDLWRSQSTVRSTGKDDSRSPDGMKIETRDELIDSIVGLIQSKSDGKARPNTPEKDRDSVKR